MPTKVHETHTVHVRCIHKKISHHLGTVSKRLRGWRGGANKAADLGLGAEGGGKGVT